MSLRNQILDDIKSAMKSKETVKLDTLRFLNSAIKNREIEARPNPLTEDDVLAVVKKAIKQRKESIEQYVQASRQDLADKEQAELDVLSSYLPAQLGREQIEGIVAQVMAELKVDSVKGMGQVIKEVMVRCKGAADNKLISEIVKSKLN